MSWIADDLSARLRHELGVYGWWEWPRFCDEHGIEVRFVPKGDPDSPEGWHVEVLKRGRWRRVIWVRDMSPGHVALVIWHEIAHLMGFPLNYLFWMGLNGGWPVVRKMERRAEHFARVFPDWTGHRSPFLPY